jgi:ABC-2 type transport system permease protein
MEYLSLVGGALRYEFRMQVRRLALWIPFLFVAVVLMVSGALLDLQANTAHLALTPLVVNWTYNLNQIVPVIVGVLLADRLVRDRRTRIEELLNTLPGALSARLLGKYGGCVLATFLPMLLLYSLGIGAVFAGNQQVQVFPLALAAAASILLPGFLLISACSLAVPRILWMPAYQVLFVAYWFWGNLLNPSNGIPTISTTLLTPVGGYMASGFFNVAVSPVGTVSPAQGVMSLLVLPGIAAVVLLLLCVGMSVSRAAA